MADEKVTADRLSAFSAAVFAVIVTIMVLELEAPDEAEFSALISLWPTAISYAVSYLFIAIIWINHHYLMRFVGAPTLGLIWINFIRTSRAWRSADSESSWMNNSPLRCATAAAGQFLALVPLRAAQVDSRFSLSCTGSMRSLCTY